MRPRPVTIIKKLQQAAKSVAHLGCYAIVRETPLMKEMRKLSELSRTLGQPSDNQET